jgi:hypothetical protein
MASNSGRNTRNPLITQTTDPMVNSSKLEIPSRVGELRLRPTTIYSNTQYGEWYGYVVSDPVVKDAFPFDGLSSSNPIACGRNECEHVSGGERGWLPWRRRLLWRWVACPQTEEWHSPTRLGAVGGIDSSLACALCVRSSRKFFDRFIRIEGRGHKYCGWPRRGCVTTVAQNVGVGGGV